MNLKLVSEGVIKDAFGTHKWKTYTQIPTGADRVRSMTDEEIENWFWWMHKEMMRYTDSRVFVHNWLKQETEEGEMWG